MYFKIINYNDDKIINKAHLLFLVDEPTGKQDSRWIFPVSEPIHIKTKNNIFNKYEI